MYMNYGAKPKSDGVVKIDTSYELKNRFNDDLDESKINELRE